MFADDSSTIITSLEQIHAAREAIFKYEKASCSELHEGKTVVIKLEKSQKKEITQASMKVNFSVMEVNDTETYLGDIIGNNV